MAIKGNGGAAAPDANPAEELGQIVESAQRQLREAASHPAIRSDPTRLFLGGISTSLDTMQKLVQRMQEMAPQSRLLSPEAEKELGHEASRDIALAMRDTIRSSISWVRPASIAAVAGITLLVGGAGFALGRWSSDARVRWIEGASFVAQISALNDATDLRSYCLAHARAQSGDNIACDLGTVWVLRPQPATEQASVKMRGTR